MYQAKLISPHNGCKLMFCIIPTFKFLAFIFMFYLLGKFSQYNLAILQLTSCLSLLNAGVTGV